MELPLQCHHEHTNALALTIDDIDMKGTEKCIDLSTASCEQAMDVVTCEQEMSTSIACQAYHEMSSKCVQARVSPAKCSRGMYITALSICILSWLHF